MKRRCELKDLKRCGEKNDHPLQDATPSAIAMMKSEDGQSIDHTKLYEFCLYSVVLPPLVHEIEREVSRAKYHFDIEVHSVMFKAVFAALLIDRAAKNLRQIGIELDKFRDPPFPVSIRRLQTGSKDRTPTCVFMDRRTTPFRIFTDVHYNV